MALVAERDKLPKSTSKGRKHCSEKGGIPNISHTPERSPKDQPREKRRARPLRLFLWGRERRSLAPSQPAPSSPPSRRENLLCHGCRAAPSLPVPVPLELRHPPVHRTTTASN